MTTDYRALCAELIDAMASTGEAASGTYSALLIRARAALAQPEPEVRPSDEELDRLEHLHWEETGVEEWGRREAIFNHRSYARAVLARWGRSVPTPAEGEVAWLIEFLRNFGDELMNEHGGVAEHNLLASAADLLEQHNPAPVPVSERLPGAEDCDAEGRCWIGYPEWTYGIADTGDTDTTTPEWRLEHQPLKPKGSRCCWLPAHALPLPSGEVEP